MVPAQNYFCDNSTWSQQFYMKSSVILRALLLLGINYIKTVIYSHHPSHSASQVNSALFKLSLLSLAIKQWPSSRLKLSALPVLKQVRKLSLKSKMVNSLGFSTYAEVLESRDESYVYEQAWLWKLIDTEPQFHTVSPTMKNILTFPKHLKI